MLSGLDHGEFAAMGEWGGLAEARSQSSQPMHAGRGGIAAQFDDSNEADTRLSRITGNMYLGEEGLNLGNTMVIRINSAN